MVYNWVHKPLAFLLPSSCSLCHGPSPEGLSLCPACHAELPLIGIHCSTCAVPLGEPGTCGRCLKTPPAYDQVLAAWHYRSPLDSLVQQLKYRHHFEHIHLFTERMHHLLETIDPVPDMIIPVPLHTSRLRRRGYNQAWELARRLSRLSTISVDATLCQRILPTPSQTDLNAKQRRCNLRGAFKVSQGLGGMNILVVDDVMTTGSTMQAIAEVLKKAGAMRVTGLVVARAISARQT